MVDLPAKAAHMAFYTLFLMSVWGTVINSVSSMEPMATLGPARSTFLLDGRLPSSVVAVPVSSSVKSPSNSVVPKISSYTSSSTVAKPRSSTQSSSTSARSSLVSSSSSLVSKSSPADKSAAPVRVAANVQPSSVSSIVGTPLSFALPASSVQPASPIPTSNAILTHSSTLSSNILALKSSSSSVQSSIQSKVVPDSSSSTTSRAVPTISSSSASTISQSSNALQSSSLPLSMASSPSSTVSSRVFLSSATPSSNSITKSVTPAPTPVLAIIDLGCYQDAANMRALSGPSFVSSKNMTNEVCADFCTKQGYPFSGTEYSQECYCSLAAPITSAAWWCSMPCAANSSEICGGGNAISAKYQPMVNASTKAVYLGCFIDSASSRTLGNASFTSSQMTNEVCSSFCENQGYPFSGTEYASECYCSSKPPAAVSATWCNMKCSGDSNSVCGGGGALSIMKRVPRSTTTGSPVTQMDLGAAFSSWRSWKSRGTNLGNWLLLEKWMHPSWFNSHSKSAVDEWTFCKNLGPTACASALATHWDSWVTLADISQLASIGVNTLRIPVGFWAFIDPLPTEPYVRTTQLEHLNRMIGYAVNNGIYVVIDIHGLPGSQNGKDHSGQEGSTNWYTPVNQARSLAAVTAAAQWIQSNTYRSYIIALEVANEPAIADYNMWLKYKDYVLAAYDIVNLNAPGLATMFHDGFWGSSLWNNYFSATDNVVLDVHNYWAFAPTTFQAAINDVCAYVHTFDGSNIPIFVGEFSLSIQLKNINLADIPIAAAIQFFHTQMKAWVNGAGGAFWSIKVMNADGKTQNPAWSVQGLLESGVLNGIQQWDFSQSLC